MTTPNQEIQTSKLSFPLKLVDRTRTVADWKCPRARYWGYEAYGKGIQSKGTNLDLFIGIVVHDAMAAIAKLSDTEGFTIDPIAEAAFTQIEDSILQASGPIVDQDAQDFAKEQATLSEGMIRGFYKHVWPKLREQYPRIVAIEQEMEYDLGDGLIFMTKPDLIVEDRDGELVYIEYKTTSSKKDSWINSWQTAVQLHSSIMAVEQTLGRMPAYVQILGLYKGFESYGKQSSPFCYAYVRQGKPPFTREEVQYSYKAGFYRKPTWEMEGGVKAWVDRMPDNILTDQFPMTAPIMVDQKLVTDFFIQRSKREAEIQRGVQVMRDSPEDATIVLDEVFPQKFDQCVPSFGSSCQYRKLCHGTVRNPLENGYAYRIPHHDREVEEHKKLEVKD